MKKLLALLFLLASVSGYSQYTDILLPRSSPFVSSTIRIGLTDIRVEYSSPRAGGRKIFGNVVPYNSDVPWRAGANECTVIQFNTDVLIEGKPLKAGRYGLFMTPSEQNTWKIIFSNNSEYWGGYYYNSKQDALRVEVQPVSCAFREELDYIFLERKINSVTIALEWEKLRIPFRIEVNTVQNTIASLRNELSGNKGNNWYAWIAAARYCLRNNVNLEEALSWTDRAMAGGYGGYQAATNFQTLFTRYRILAVLERTQEAAKVYAEALPLLQSQTDYSWLAADFVVKKDYDKAIETMNKAINQCPKGFVLYQELADIYLQKNDRKKAIELYRQALPYTPAEYKNLALTFIREQEAQIK